MTPISFHCAKRMLPLVLLATAGTGAAQAASCSAHVFRRSTIPVLAAQYAAAGTVSLSSSQRQACATPLEALRVLALNPFFRAKVYAHVGNLKSAAQRATLQRVGGFFDTATSAARDAYACGQIQPVYISVVQQLNRPFAVAAIGRGAVDDPRLAVRLADTLLTRVGALVGLVPPDTCKVDYRVPFQAYSMQMLQFSQGSSKWAPGCSARIDHGQATLRCLPLPAKKTS